MSDNVRAKPSKPKTDLPTDQPCPPGGMTLDEYRTRAKDMVDYIANYLDTIRDRRVFPDVSPGYMAKLVPDACPVRPEAWEDIMADVERVIMPGVTHWLSPHNHSYFPALSSFPSLLGDMLADAVNNLGFTWASSPACTELETIVMDWLGKMIGLPPVFLHGNKMRKSLGGGCIQTTASDCTFVTLLAARKDAIRRIKVTSPDMDDAEINGRLIGYCSDQAHSSVEKAGLIGLVKLRFLPSDENLSLRGDTLQEAVSRDKEMGLIPFYLCATLGTTGACAFDNLKEIGPICQAENMWLHIDAAYAGSAFICPEYRHLMAGIEFSNSFAFNPSKWLMVHFDCSAMWVRDATDLHRTFNVEPLYLQHENSGAAIDYMHWQIALSRRFRSLKLWFVLRSFGVEGLQAHIRRGVEKAIYFERLVRADRRFEIPARRHLGLVVFRLMGPNQLTETLLKRLNKQGEIHMVPASLQGKYVIRFTVTSQYTTQEDIDRDWKIITDMSSKILSEARTTTEDSILEKEEEELEEEIENDFGEENTAYDDDDNDDDGDEDGGVENDTEEEDLEVSFTKEGDEFDFKMKKGVSSDSSSTHFNGYISHGKENGTAERRNNNDNNEAGVDDNDDGDNDERNRKIKKMNGSARKHANDLEPLKTTAVKPRQKSNSLSEENACGKFENEVGSPPKLNSSNQQTAGGQVGSTDRKKPPCGNLKILNSKSAAAKRRDYGFSLLLSNVPMSPKIVNGSFAALFDGEDGEGSCNSLDLSSLTRNWGGGMGGEFIRLSPRKRGKLSGAEKQLSLDYGVLSASHKTCPSRMAMMGSLDSKIDDILELSTALKGAKNKKGKQEGDGEGTKDTETASEDCVGDNDVDEKGVGVQGDGGENGKNGLGKGIGAVVKENGSSLKMEGGMENAQVVGGGGKGGNKNGGKGERMKSDMKGNGRVVMEKENWDTGHARDVTSVNEINDASGPGQKQKSVCPLCGRCDV